MELPSTLLIGVGGAGSAILKAGNCLQIDLKANINRSCVFTDSTHQEAFIGLSDEDFKTVRLDSELPETAKQKLVSLVSKYDQIAVFVGLGGLLGSSVIQPLITLCNNTGKNLVLITSLPFLYEGSRREKAIATLNHIKHLDCAISVYDLAEESKKYPRNCSFDAMIGDINKRMMMARIEKDIDSAGISFDDQNINSHESLQEAYPNAYNLSFLCTITQIEASDVDEANLIPAVNTGFEINVRVKTSNASDAEQASAELYFTFASYHAYNECLSHLEQAYKDNKSLIATSDIYSFTNGEATLFGPKLTILRTNFENVLVKNVINTSTKES
ncbi:hypothetical protein ACMXYO_01155 [Neptuniibacter sp. QD37_6]|uniref:hypothetical protein n=1 Tax=Neptuniibacter sp. QD37_6 TaxID=3398210 RepID=UPI0039F50880